MSKEKQIEAMAYEMTQYKETVCNRIEHNKCLLKFHTHAFIDCHFCKLAEHLITEKGYRKAAEVALEVINKALSKIQIMISSIKAQEENGNITEFNGGAKTALEIVFKDLAELKKKYTEGEE